MTGDDLGQKDFLVDPWGRDILASCAFIGRAFLSCLSDKFSSWQMKLAGLAAQTVPLYRWGD